MALRFFEWRLFKTAFKFHVQSEKEDFLSCEKPGFAQNIIFGANINNGSKTPLSLKNGIVYHTKQSKNW